MRTSLKIKRNDIRIREEESFLCGNLFLSKLTNNMRVSLIMMRIRNNINLDVKNYSMAFISIYQNGYVSNGSTRKWKDVK